MRKNHVFGMGFFIFFTILWCTILSINVQPAQAATYTVTVNANGNGIGGTVSSTPATTGISYNYSGTPTSGSASFNSGTQVVLTAAVAYPDAMTAASCSSVNCSTASWGDTCANAGGTPGTAAGNGTTLATCTFASLDGNKTVAVTFEADIALVATPTCSSETKFYGTTEVDQLCTSAINGIVDGSGGPVPEFSNTTGNPDIPGDNADPNYFSAEWAAAGEAPAYITLTWTTPYVVDRIVLYDRPNSTDQVWTGIINFSDGSSVAVGNLSNDGAGVIFDSAHNADFTPSPKTITSLTFNITSAGGTNTGLAEIMVYGLPILTVTATPGSNGTLDPSTTSPASIVYGNTTAFKFNATTGYHVASITDTCGGSGYTNTSNSVSTYTYTTPAITAACTVSATFAINQYTLTYTPGAGGSISGSSPQTVNYGGSGTAVTAVPATGYHFVQWSDLSTTNPRTDTGVTANISVTASFAINTYTLTYTAGANGSISGTSPQTVNYGGSGTAVTAVPALGYHFVNWSDSSTANPRTDTNVTANITVTASFAINTYQVTAAAGANGSLDGTTPSPATVNYNATAAFKFNASANYHVATISDTCGGSGYTNSSNTVSTYTYTTPAITAACGVTAAFAINTFQVTAAAGSNGSLDGTTPSPATVNYNATAAFKFNANTNYHVATITDTCGGSGYTNTSNSISTYTYTTPAITGACAVSATFGINQFQVTANADVTGNGTGSVSSSVGGISYSYPTTKTGTTTSLNYGTSVVLTATTGVGSAASWGNTCTTAGGAEAGDGTTSASCTFGSLDGNKTVTVAFGLNQYTVTANVDLSGDGIGSVSSSPGGINYNYPANSTGTTTLLSYGTKVVLTATATKTAKTGSTASWNGTCATAGGSETGNGTTSATCTFGQLNATATVTVTFTYDATITTPKTPTGPKTVTTGTAYKYATGGSSVKTGDPVEYQFDWGDGTDPSPYGSASQSKMWLSGSTYSVRARARSTLNHDLVSVWSGALVVSPTDKPFIHVTSPNGGETWVVGTTHPITWNSKYLGSTDTIYLYYWYAGKWYPITNSIDTPSIGPSTGTSSSYNWIIPDLPPTSPASGPTVPKSHMAWTAIYIGDMQTNGTWLCWDTNDKNFKILDNGWAFTISGADKGGATLFFNTDGSFDGYGISLKRGMFKIQGSYTVGANGSISGPYTLTDFESGDVLVSGNITTGTMNPNATTMTLTLKDSSSPPVAVFSMSGVWLSDLTMPENWSVQISGSAKGTISPSNPLKIETYKDLNNEPYANVFDVSGSGFLPDAITPISITGYFFFTPLKTVYGFFDQLTIGSNPEETGTISGTLNLSTGKFTFNLTTTSTNGNGHKYTFAGVKVVAP